MLHWATVGPKLLLWLIRGFSWEIPPKLFCNHNCTLSCCKVWKTSFEQIPRYKLAYFWATIWIKLPNWLKWGFFGKFHSSHFSLLIVLYHAAKFQKNLGADPNKFYKVKEFTSPHSHTQRQNQQQVFQLNKYE